MNKKTKEKIMIEVGGFNDVASDLRDIWSDLNDFLDYENKREKDVLDDFLGVIINFEEEINKSLGVIDNLKEDDYKPYTDIDNIVNDMLSVGGKKK